MMKINSMLTVSIRILIARLAVLLLFLPIVACHAAERPVPIMAMNAADMFPDRRVRELAVAAEAGNIDLIDSLVQRGVAIDSTGEYGITPLFWAMQRQNKEGFKRLLELGADPNHLWTNGDSTISWAAYIADPYFLEQVLVHGGDVNLRNPNTHQTPIFRAVNSSVSSIKNVELLIENGAELNIQERVAGLSPVSWAASRDRYDYLYLMLSAGGDPELKTFNSGWDALYYIRNRKGREEGIPGMPEWREKVIALLREKGYDVE